MARKFFGTDGVRGRVGEKITPEFALKLGWAAGKVLSERNKGKKCRVLIGKDTRISCYMIESALEAGFAAAGVESYLTGPMPTPAISYLTRTFRMDSGVVISASHNPYYDNGIKFFDANGTKLPDEAELEIEQLLDQDLICVPNELLGRAYRIDDARGRYIEFCKASFSTRFTLHGLKVVVDASNGAGYYILPSVFNELGAEVKAIATTPNGVNINKDCGSTHLDTLINEVKNSDVDLGVALDGDGDRVMLVDSEGNVIDGDQILYILARYEQDRGKLGNKGVVGTLMSNNGLEVALKKLGIPFERAAVGDRYVVQKLLENDWYLGGENSGHILHLHKNKTGDGIIAALATLRALNHFNKSLKDFAKECPLFPQVMINVGLKDLKPKVLEIPELQQYIKEQQDILANDGGRILIRPSGTEPIIRVMVEHPVEKTANDFCNQLVTKINEYKN